jgi:signal transduction histidine kinase
MRLRNKITLPTAAIGLLLLVLGVSGAWYVLRLQRLNSKVLDVNVSSIRTAEEMEMVVREMRHELNRFLLTQDRGHLVRVLEKQPEMEVWLEQARVLSMLEREGALVAEMRRDLDKFYARLRQLVEMPDESVSTAAVESLVDELLTTRVLVNTRAYLDLNEQELQNSNQQNKAMAERLAMALLLLGTCGAIAGLVAGFGVARGINRSIFQLSVPIRDVAGKLNEVVGPVEVSADPSVTELETLLQTVSAKVGAVVEQLHARHREVIRADQLAAVGQLAAGLAHELRNPLMCMKTLVQSARRRGGDAHLDSRDLKVLDEEISRLEKLLQSFLDFARPAKPETHDVDLAHIVRQTVGLLSRRAEARSVTIGCRLSELPLVVDADENQLRQVLLNLLLNALDAVQNGGKIWVDAVHANNGQAALKSDGRGQPCVRLRVADNGRGLPASDRGRIYEPFFSTKETGLGLGLAISQRIIDAHGGELIARDRDGGGAIFEIQLPSRATV